jgi:hypothetical protein
MGELFVQESPIASEKEKEVQQNPEDQKKIGGKENTRTGVKGNERVVYSHEEAVDASIRYFNGDELAAK